MGRRSPRSVLLVIGVLLAAGCVTDPTAMATPSLASPSTGTSSPTTAAAVAPSAASEPGGVYLALGDSITFGIGVSRPREDGYVAQVANALATAERPVSETRVFAVPGETASGFLDRRLDDVVRAIEDAGPRVELVTIGLGANEILRARRDAACLVDRAGDVCRAVVDAATQVAASSLDTVVAGVQAALDAAGSEAMVLLLAYYNPDLDPLATESVAGSDGVVGCSALEVRPGLNDRVACIAAERSVGLVDLYNAFLGRESELTRFGSGDVHPNAAGYAVIASAILDRIATREP